MNYHPVMMNFHTVLLVVLIAHAVSVVAFVVLRIVRAHELHFHRRWVRVATPVMWVATLVLTAIIALLVAHGALVMTGLLDMGDGR